jgi:hypothetical protein
LLTHFTHASTERTQAARTKIEARQVKGGGGRGEGRARYLY